MGSRQANTQAKSSDWRLTHQLQNRKSNGADLRNRVEQEQWKQASDCNRKIQFGRIALRLVDVEEKNLAEHNSQHYQHWAPTWGKG